MKKYNLVISGIVMLLSFWMLNSSLSMNEAVSGTAMGSGAWPTILAILMIILAVVLTVETIINWKKDEENAEPFDFKSSGMKRIYILVAILVVFAVLLTLFGFYFAIVFLIVSVLLLLGERRPWMIAALTVGIVVFVYIVFVFLLSLKLPTGSILSL